MNNGHLGEIELAQLSDKAGREAVGAEIVEHLRWCARCRSAVADYGWLQREISATLTAAADGVFVPRPQWWAVQERVFAGRRRQITAWRVSSIAGVALAVCLMVAGATIAASPAPSTGAVAQTLSPELVVAPAPVTVIASGEHSISMSMATPTPAMSCDVTLLSPALGLPPTPPELETRGP